MIFNETIYRCIWEDKHREEFNISFLEDKDIKILLRMYDADSFNIGDIDERPKIVEIKDKFGDLEIDTIIDKNYKGAILIINDR